jgi:hypothetical protein
MAWEVASTSRGQKSVQISHPLHNSSFISIIFCTNTTETDEPGRKYAFTREYYNGNMRKIQVFNFFLIFSIEVGIRQNPGS